MPRRPITREEFEQWWGPPCLMSRHEVASWLGCSLWSAARFLRSLEKEGKAKVYRERPLKLWSRNVAS
jgi:hypothetical protein